MEIRVSLVLLGLLVLVHSGLRAEQPVAALQGPETARTELSDLEDRVAREPANAALVRQLSASYLRLGKPALAVAAIRSAEPRLLEDPLLAARLARAYEATGNLADAAATAQLAVARCLRAAGSSAALGAQSAFACSELSLILLEQHRDALWNMMRWGVTDPLHDPRRELAYQLAERSASIASFRTR
jgi:hypothetical protein